MSKKHNLFESSGSELREADKINETRDMFRLSKQKQGFTDQKLNSYNSRQEPFTTNKTIKYFQGTNKAHYYLTSYVRVKVISLSVVNYQEMSANLNCQFSIDISYRDLGRHLKTFMLKHGIRISFQADESLLLTRQNADVSVYDNEGEKKISYLVRKFVKTRVNCTNLFLSPFELATCQISLKINKLKIPHQKKDEEKEIGTLKKLQLQYIQENQQDRDLTSSEIHFNMMDHQDMNVKISSSSDSSFGLFQIAALRLNAYYSTKYCQPPALPAPKESNNSLYKRFLSKKASKKVSSESNHQLLPLIKRKYGQERLLQFNVANFDVPLFKDPSVAILTIFLPLLILGVINIGVFYQQPQLAKRITSIAAIMVSIIALIPTIRAQIPPTQVITLVQLLVIAEAFTAILALFESVRVEGTSLEDQFIFNGLQNGFFMVSAIITIIVCLTIIVLLLLFFCLWRPTYTDKKALQVQQLTEQFNLNIYEWKNRQCDAYFHQFYQSGTIQLREDRTQKKHVLTKNIFGLGLIQDQNQLQRDRQQLETKKQFNTQLKA